jgi:hypothetical protein
MGEKRYTFEKYEIEFELGGAACRMEVTVDGPGYNMTLEKAQMLLDNLGTFSKLTATGFRRVEEVPDASRG